MSRGRGRAVVGMEMVVEESRSEVEEFIGDCRKSESGRSAAVEVKADGWVMIPVVGKMRGKKGGRWVRRGGGEVAQLSGGGGGDGGRRRRQ